MLPLIAALAVGQAADPATDRCRYVQGVAASERALLFSPQLFASAGLARAEILGPQGVAATGTRPRILAGLELDASRLRRGIAAGHLADATCALEEAEEDLARFTLAGDALVQGPALRARLEILEQALPEARDLVARVREGVARGTAALPEQQAAELRLSRLTGAIGDARRALSTLPPAPDLDRAALESRLALLARARQQVHEAEAEARASSALTLSFRGGVDRVIDDTSSDRLPLFGLLTVSWYPGGLWQPAAEARAGEGLARWSEHTAGGAAERAARQVRGLERRRELQATRLAEARLLLADLESRRALLGEIAGERARTLRDAMLFDLSEARAEVAALEAELAALDHFLGP